MNDLTVRKNVPTEMPDVPTEVPEGSESHDMFGTINMFIRLRSGFQLHSNG